MRGCIVKRGERRYALVIELPPHPDGRRRQKWVTVHGTLRQAQSRLREVLDDLEHHRVEPGKVTVGEILKDWLEAVQSKVSAKTWMRYEEVVRLHLIPAFGRIEAQKLTPSAIEAAYRQARESGRADGKGGLSERTVLHHHRILSEAMKRAVRLKVLRSNPCADVVAPSPQRRPMRVLSADELAILLQASAGTRLYAPILLAVSTGLRLGELLGLRWTDLDGTARTLRVEQTVQRVRGLGVTIKPTPKTRSSLRVVALPDGAVAALRRHEIEQKEQRLSLGPLWDDHGLIFPNPVGAPWSPDAVSHAFTDLAKAHGLPVTFHGLRHYHASHLLAAGIHPKLASDRLGHSTIAITMDLYSHLLEGEQRKCADAMDALLANLSVSKPLADPGKPKG